jgi:hypothetical protein
MNQKHTNSTLLVGITWDGDVKLLQTTDAGVLWNEMTPSAARFIAQEMLAAADRADAVLLQIRARDAGVASEARP